MKLEEHLSYLIASVNRQLETEMQERLREEGMPIERWRILEVLDGEDGVPMGELAGRALLEPTTLTKIIDRMLADGLVLRLLDERDRRRVLVTLTPTGKAAVRRLNRIGATQEARLKKRLPKEKLVELRTLLRELAEP